MILPLPNGTFSYAKIHGKRVNSLDELIAALNPKTKRVARKQAWLDKDKRDKIDSVIAKMGKEGVERLGIIAFFRSDGVEMITDEQGNALSREGVSSRVYRVFKEAGLCKGRPKRYKPNDDIEEIKIIITPMIQECKTYQEILDHLINKDLMGRTSQYKLRETIRTLQKSLGVERNLKKDLIIDLYKQGKSKRAIMKTAKVSKSYVDELILFYKRRQTGGGGTQENSLSPKTCKSAN